MKKIFFLGLILTLFAAAASAQQMQGSGFRHHREMQAHRHRDLNRHELRRLHHDELRYGVARRRAHRDGIITPLERRRLNKMRHHERRESFRYSHNNRRHVI